MKTRLLLILLLLPAFLFLSGCAEKQENDEGDEYYQDDSLKSVYDVQFESEEELVAFLKDDKKVEDFEKDQIPVFGFYYRLKKLPYKVSSVEISYSQDSATWTYYTDDPGFKQQNGGGYIAVFTWCRDTSKAQALLQDAIANGVPPVQKNKNIGGKAVYYGQDEYPGGAGNPSIYSSGYYFVEDGFFFSVNLNMQHGDVNFEYCEPEKIQMR